MLLRSLFFQLFLKKFSFIEKTSYALIGVFSDSSKTDTFLKICKTFKRKKTCFNFISLGWPLACFVGVQQHIIKIFGHRLCDKSVF